LNDRIKTERYQKNFAQRQQREVKINKIKKYSILSVLIIIFVHMGKLRLTGAGETHGSRGNFYAFRFAELFDTVTPPCAKAFRTVAWGFPETVRIAFRSLNAADQFDYIQKIRFHGRLLRFGIRQISAKLILKSL
jgi:hypothetical protein